MKFKEIEGNIIELAKSGNYDAIVHGCNCFNTQKAGLALQMDKEFETSEASLEYYTEHYGDIDKLGRIQVSTHIVENNTVLNIINAYTQYYYGFRNGKAPVDYEAITLCMRKINHNFKGKSILVPLIGCGLAGGDWNIVKPIIQRELVDMDVTIVHYEQ